MLKIRLRRTGAKKQPRYRVVVAESSAPRDGAFVEILGWYNPQADPAQVVINTEKADEWIKRGAQPSDRVAYLLKQASLAEAEAPTPEPEAPKGRRPRAGAPRSEAPAAEAVSAGAVEAEAAQPEAPKAAARGRSRAKPAAESEASAGEAEGDTGDAEPTSGQAAEVPASEAPEEEGSAGTSTS